MKNTVTDGGASVASTESIEEALESGFLPSDPEYRKTGKFSDPKPAAKPEKTDEEEQQEYEQQLEEQSGEQHDEQDPAASGEQDGESAAASQAAETAGEKTGKPSRSRGQSESRWAKLSRENRELRERLARAEGQHEPAAAQTRDSSQASQPAAAATPKGRAEPKIDDVDPKTGQPKYADYDEFIRDQRKWDREQAVLEFEAKNATTERERQQRAVQETISREWTRRVTEAEKEMPDFREVALDVDVPVKAGSVVDAFILDSPIGPKVLYNLAKDPDLLERIQGTPVYDNKGVLTGFRGGMNPLAQARELTKLELKLSGSGRVGSSAQPVSAAPRPPHQSSGKGTVTKDAVEEAVKTSDQNTYARSANERDPRLLAVRRARKQTA